MQNKISALLRMADDAAASMNNELRVQLVKIPKQVPSSTDKHAEVSSTVTHNFSVQSELNLALPHTHNLCSRHMTGSCCFLDTLDEALRVSGQTRR